MWKTVLHTQACLIGVVSWQTFYQVFHVTFAQYRKSRSRHSFEPPPSSILLIAKWTCLTQTEMVFKVVVDLWQLSFFQAFCLWAPAARNNIRNKMLHDFKFIRNKHFEITASIVWKWIYRKNLLKLCTKLYFYLTNFNSITQFLTNKSCKTPVVIVRKILTPSK